MMRIAIPKEITPFENRVSLVPQLSLALQALGCTLCIEKGAGEKAYFDNKDYPNTVEWFDDPTSLYAQADLILKVEPPFKEEIALFKPGSTLVGLLSPSLYPDRIQALKEKKITSFALELIPRISRAQSMDALSSQATVAGYKAALLGAHHFPRFFPMLSTAAGTIRPANVLVIGAGVAGLQAIATARRLGGVVRAYDIRPSAREQIESLGAKMIDIDLSAEATGGYARELTQAEQEKQQAALLSAVSKAEVVIATAFVPGRPAPKIITTAMVESMLPGSVIIDAAAIAGGNCELSRADETFLHRGILIAGPTRLPSLVPKDASTLYAKNILSFLQLLIQDQKISLNQDDPILAESLLTHDGEIKHAPTRAFIENINEASHG